MKLHSLYGGYMSIYLPENACDVSDVREVPDNQEVFTHSATDQSIIIDILEYVPEQDEQALKTHFEDLAGSNEAVGPENARILNVEQIPAAQLAMTECQGAYVLHGQQMVAKFNETAKNTLSVSLGLFRLPEFETDILVTFNDPVNISPDSSSHGPVPVSSEPWTLEHFKQSLLTLKILNTELFGS